MKLVMDERLKHRLIGLAVVISLAAIFAPAMMKNPNRTEDNLNVHVKLPPKPQSPKIAIVDEKDMFKTIKVSRVDIPPVSDEDHLPQLAKAETLNSDLPVAHQESIAAQVEPSIDAKAIKLAVNEAAKVKVKQMTALAQNHPVKPLVPVASKPRTIVAVVAKPKVKQTIKPAVKQSVYAVQLASFSQLSNAQTLVNRLRAKGYKSNYVLIKTRQGPIYKVFAGHSPTKNDALKLKTQLASSLQLNGFVVNTGVS